MNFDGHDAELLYQPIVSSGSTVAVEALLRIRRPTGALASAQPLLSRVDLLPRISRWVVDSAADARAHLDLPVHVNVPPHLINHMIVGWPDGVVMEVTEEPTDLDQMQAAIRCAAAAGITVMLDDIGAGDDVFRRVAHAHGAAGVKLDRIYTDALADDWSRTVAGRFVDLLRGLDLRIIAERVETDAEARSVAELGISDMQGFYFGFPEPLNAVAQTLPDVPSADDAERRAA